MPLEAANKGNFSKRYVLGDAIEEIEEFKVLEMCDFLKEESKGDFFFFLSLVRGYLLI